MRPINQTDLDKLRSTLLRFHQDRKLSHFGSSNSCLEILATLIPNLTELDTFHLSKGHGISALLASLHYHQLLSDTDFELAIKLGSEYWAHPSFKTSENPKVKNYLPFGSGSLGHGLSLMAGLALGNQISNLNCRQYVLLSDGECNEGSTWEGALFASRNRLSKLFVLIDCNGHQAMEAIFPELEASEMQAKWQAFGFHCEIINQGNSLDSLQNLWQQENHTKRLENILKPKALLFKTAKNHNFESQLSVLDSHYRLPKVSM